MGVDLTLLPVSREHENGDLVCDHAFNLDLNIVVRLVLDLEMQSTSATVYWPIAHSPESIRALLPKSPTRGGPQEDCLFGRSEHKHHRYVLAKDIKGLWETRGDVLDEANDFERAAFAFISNLDEQTKVLVHSW